MHLHSFRPSRQIEAIEQLTRVVTVAVVGGVVDVVVVLERPGFQMSKFQNPGSNIIKNMLVRCSSFSLTKNRR
jgi:hypothetical protein